MKKIFLLAITIMVTSITFAQGISIGAKAGINYGATVTSNADFNDDFQATIGPHFGVVADIALTDDFSVQPELLFSPSGSKLKEVEEGGFTFNGKSSINYISLPIMAKYYFVDGLSLEAGPYIGFLLSAKSDFTMTDSDGNTIDEFSWEDEDTKEHYNSIDYGLGVGASYALEMGVFFTARYNMGLSTLYKDITELGLDEDDTIKNNIFQFSVGYKFM